MYILTKWKLALHDSEATTTTNNNNCLMIHQGFESCHGHLEQDINQQWLTFAHV